MKINNVNIGNWETPGPEWWDRIQARPNEPLIEATIQFTLSWNEYRRLLDTAEKEELPNSLIDTPPVFP